MNGPTNVNARAHNLIATNYLLFNYDLIEDHGGNLRRMVVSVNELYLITEPNNKSNLVHNDSLTTASFRSTYHAS